MQSAERSQGIRRLGAWGATGVALAVIAFEVHGFGPIAFGDYQLSLLAQMVSDALTVGLLALFLFRPVRAGRDAVLISGALLMSLAVTYRLAIELIDGLAPNNFTGVFTGLLVDPLLEAGSVALGVWLLAVGVVRFGVVPGWWRERRVMPAAVASTLVGAICFGLTTGSALLLGAASFYNPGLFDDANIAVFALPAAALAWTVLAIAALAAPITGRARLMLIGAALLILAAVGLNAFTGLVAEWWWGPLRTWFPWLLDWHGAYVYVAVLDAVGRIALFAAFLEVTSLSPRPSVATPTGVPRLQSAA